MLKWLCIFCKVNSYDVSLRERTLSIIILRSGIHTWVSTYPPKPAAYGSSDREPLHTRMLRDKPTDCTVIPGFRRKCFFPQCQRTSPLLGSKLGRLEAGLYQVGNVGIDFYLVLRSANWVLRDALLRDLMVWSLAIRQFVGNGHEIGHTGPYRSGFFRFPE